MTTQTFLLGSWPIRPVGPLVLEHGRLVPIVALPSKRVESFIEGAAC